jgi:ribosome biogenesis protein BMS1
LFNPLRVPLKLQAALPFKSKPKLDAARAPGRRKPLEQRHAVVLERDEKRAASLLQQLSAIRNAKAEKRRSQAQRRRDAHAKQAAKEAEWRGAHSKQERKRRYAQQGQAAARAAAAASGGGKYAKRGGDGGGGGGGKRRED